MKCIVVLSLAYLLLEDLHHLLAEPVKDSKKIAGKQDSVNQCDELREKHKILVTSKKVLESELLKCTQKDRCPSKGKDGIYPITVAGIKTFSAPCKSCGWLIFQRRFDGSENFNRGWKLYKNGFGNIKGEFFIGLEKLHLITKANDCEIYIELKNKKGESRYAQYDKFVVGSEKESYRLKAVGKYSGTAGDSLTYHEKMKFSTYDRDSDLHTENCAKHHHGGWWFKKCATSSLNGKYYKSGKKPDKQNYGIFWGSWNKDYDFNISLTSAVMMIKPKCRTLDVL